MPAPAHYQPQQPSPPRISNREPIRLEIPVTHTKQTPAPISNREKLAVFKFHANSPRIAPPSEKGEQKANRENILLESPVTIRKCSTAPHSNREKTQLFAHQKTPKNPKIGE